MPSVKKPHCDNTWSELRYYANRRAIQQAQDTVSLKSAVVIIVKEAIDYKNMVDDRDIATLLHLAARKLRNLTEEDN